MRRARPGSANGQRRRPPLNVGFTLYGLHALGVPANTLQLMPTEFIEGAGGRSKLLGDSRRQRARPLGPDLAGKRGRPGGAYLDHVECPDAADGSPVPELEQKTAWLRQLCAESKGGVTILSGHAFAGGDYQEASAVLPAAPTARCGQRPTSISASMTASAIPCSRPAHGQGGARSDVIGGGKLLPDGSWRPLATGEFSSAMPTRRRRSAPTPALVEFSATAPSWSIASCTAERRQLQVVHRQGRGSLSGALDPSRDEARETIMGEDGRALVHWRAADGGAPLSRNRRNSWSAKKAEKGADKAAYAALLRRFNDFKYRDDP